MKFSRTTTLLGGLFSCLFITAGCAQAPDALSSGSQWTQYRGNLAGTGFSPLQQINQGNVTRLQGVWSYSLLASALNADENPRAPNSQATPIVVDGVMYLPAADRVIALDPVSGEELWTHRVTESAASRRGVSYWPGDNSSRPRILYTAGRRLVALDAATGELASEFGESGEINMQIPYNSVAMVFENTVVVGANTPRGAAGGIGNARAFDARNGEKVWEFESVPQPGSLGHDTWEGDSWQGRLGANAWPFYFTVDEQRGLIYLPLASPIPFGYGGDRAGNNLFSNSLVAVDIRSGEYRWHFQTIHHDLWDHDPPAPPALFDIDKDGVSIPALGLTTKSGYLYLLNRETGEPIFDIEELPMPASDVPGEETSPTQPIPSNPPALARVSFDASDLVTANDTSAEHAAACSELLASTGGIVNQGPFTPWAYRPNGAGDRTTLLFPGLTGGPNWGGVSFDPATKYAFVFSGDIGSFGWVEESEEGAEYPMQRRGPRPGNFQVNIDGMQLPCQKPPWGTLSAVDTSTGNIAWQRAVGVSDVLPQGKQATGRPGRAAALVTAGDLLFIAATDDNRLRALDTATGNQLWETSLPKRGNANPMTYLGADGNQYVVISATDSIEAFRLP
ncbi:PQQ-binding-like beta-propeller repeat protein [Gammaproteobacteria bacterium]|jgi:glucose dehydrogenase|nr:PQQ-binding-like beta-propeller repeat protein [Pseudomonadales bacterium]MDC0413432.1 PQQ-binding-like beta-propeller repeat protein [Gammaproteobacteria bacterium]